MIGVRARAAALSQPFRHRRVRQFFTGVRVVGLLAQAGQLPREVLRPRRPRGVGVDSPAAVLEHEQSEEATGERRCRHIPGIRKEGGAQAVAVGQEDEGQVLLRHLEEQRGKGVRPVAEMPDQLYSAVALGEPAQAVGQRLTAVGDGRRPGSLLGLLTEELVAVDGGGVLGQVAAPWRSGLPWRQ